MYYYHFHQWLAFFYFYCIFGWCFETIYVSAKNKQWVNRGFMKGPWLPIYGTGAIIVLFVTLPFQDNPILVYLVGMLTATVLEYIIGAGMLAFFKVRYWDYSYRKFQLHGHICLVSSLAWGVLSLLLIYVVHKPLSKVFLALNYDLLSVIVFVFTVMIAYDFANSFRKAMDLRALIIQAEHLRKEMALRADWEIAYLRADRENRMRIANLRREYLMEHYGEQAVDQLNELERSLNEELAELKLRRDRLLENMIRPDDYAMRHNPGFKIPSLPKSSSMLREKILEEYRKKKG